MKKPRSSAKTRRGTACIPAAIWSIKSKRYTRCQNHGGMSTGPKTAEGIERIRRSHSEHGRSVRTRSTGSDLRLPIIEHEIVESLKRMHKSSARRMPFVLRGLDPNQPRKLHGCEKL